MLLLNHNWTLNLIAVLLLIKSEPESVDSHIKSLSCVSFLHGACTADVPKAVFCITVSRMPALFLVALSGFSLENPCFVLLLLSSWRLAICVYYHFKGFQNMLPKDCSWKCVNAGTFTGCRLCVSPLSWINNINKTFWNLQKLKRSRRPLDIRVPWRLHGAPSETIHLNSTCHRYFPACSSKTHDQTYMCMSIQDTW